MTDPLLAFEHRLREHIAEAQARIDAFDESMGEHNTTWRIMYDAQDGGKWSINAWRYDDIKMRGAELLPTLEATFDAIHKARGISTLRTMIAHEQKDMFE